tara:strand:- start:836 stop:1120 length:285 start_codon:yes stop_codon:yes gene_type:complete
MISPPQLAADILPKSRNCSYCTPTPPVQHQKREEEGRRKTRREWQGEMMMMKMRRRKVMTIRSDRKQGRSCASGQRGKRHYKRLLQQRVERIQR